MIVWILTRQRHRRTGDPEVAAIFFPVIVLSDKVFDEGSVHVPAVFGHSLKVL